MYINPFYQTEFGVWLYVRLLPGVSPRGSRQVARLLGCYSNKMR